MNRHARSISFSSFLLYPSNEGVTLFIFKGPIAIRMAKLAINQGMEVRLHNVLTYLVKNKGLFSSWV